MSYRAFASNVEWNQLHARFDGMPTRRQGSWLAALARTLLSHNLLQRGSNILSNKHQNPTVLLNGRDSHQQNQPNPLSQYLQHLISSHLACHLQQQQNAKKKAFITALTLAPFPCNTMSARSMHLPEPSPVVSIKNIGSRPSKSTILCRFLEPILSLLQSIHRSFTL